MSWFESGGLTNFAKSALSTAQKSIDRVLDIQQEGIEASQQAGASASLRGKKDGRSVGSSGKAQGAPDLPSSRAAPSKSVLKSPSKNPQLKSDDSFFTAFLNESTSSPVKSKQSPRIKQVRSPGRIFSSSPNGSQRLKSEEDGGDPMTKRDESVVVAIQPVKREGDISEGGVSAIPEPKRDDDGNTSEREVDTTSRDPEGTSSDVLPDGFSSQMLVPLEISLSEEDCMTSSSFVPVSKEDVEDCDLHQHAALSPCSVDDLMSISQTQLPHDSGEEIAKGEELAEKVSQSDAKSEPSSEKSDDRTTSSSSDFVVINEFAGSERSSLSNYDTRESPESQSPKHCSSSSNGKRSPDSDFSIISEGRFHDAAERPVLVTLLSDDGASAEVTPLRESHDSVDYSVDVESEDREEGFNASFKSLSSSQEAREGSTTPTQENEEMSDNVTDNILKPHIETGSEQAVTVNTEAAQSGTMSTAKDNNKDQTQDPLQTDTLLKKLAEMAEVLQARESQILSLSNKNVDLQETANILKNQLQQSENARESEMTDLSALTEEFTSRIASMEKKLQASQKERDTLKKDLQQVKQELDNRRGDNETAALMREKDETIQGLMSEGEKLSKQQLQNSNIIKKLRGKEKENESLINSQKSQLGEKTERVEHLEDVLDKKEEMEKQQKDIIKKLNIVVEKQSSDLSSLRGELDDSTERIRSTQAALDASYKDLTELHKVAAAKDSMVQVSQLSAEMSAKEELRIAMERRELETRRDQEMMMLQVSDLQMAMSRQEQQQARKEGHLRQEISDLQMRLQEAEARNQELSQSVSAATRPLLRQIENLNSTLNAQSGNWEHVERSLTERLADTQVQLQMASDKERSATETSGMAASKLASLESQLATARQDKARLQAGLEMERAKVESLEEGRERDAVCTEAQLSTYTKALQDLQRDKAHLEKQLEVEKMKVDAERRKLLLAQEMLSDKERKLNQQAEDSSSSHGNRSGASTPVHNAPTSPSPFYAPTQVDILERTMSWSASGSLYDSVAGGSASTVLEGLQSQLKQREGEIAQLQGEISQLERTRAALAEEVVKVTNINDILDEQAKQLPDYKRRLTETETRYNAVLQMYGEKAEQVQELKLDLEDVKQMYRQQIEDLIHS